MINAKFEFLDAVSGTLEKVIAAVVEYDPYPYYGGSMEAKQFLLVDGYSPNEYEEFLNQLDFEYDDGYGTQHIEGTVWLSGGSWLSRHEYDGSELWEWNLLPIIPAKLRRKDEDSN